MVLVFLVCVPVCPCMCLYVCVCVCAHTRVCMSPMWVQFQGMYNKHGVILVRTHLLKICLLHYDICKLFFR